MIAVVLGIPMGLWLGQKLAARLAFLPIINFFRNLSPLAWMPFAILWFGVGDSAAIFLIFLAAFFPVALATMAAVANIPAVYFRVAQNYGLRGSEKLTAGHAARDHAAGDHDAARDGRALLAGGRRRRDDRRAATGWVLR